MFTERPLDKEALSAALPFIERSTVIQDQPESFTILTPDEDVKVSFFGMIRIGRVAMPTTTMDGVVQIAAFDDLMAKVKVILQRIEAKDYRDIAAMISAGVSLARGLSAARQMYGQSFQPSESLKAMTYFEGGDLHLLAREERQVLVEAASLVRELPKVEIVSRELWAR